MTRNEARDRGWALVPRWWPVAVAVVSALLALGSAWGMNAVTNADQDRRLDQVDARLAAIERIDRRLSRIEGRLGIETGD